MHWQPVSNGTSQICIEATKIRVVWSDTQILQSVQIHQDPRPPSHIYIVATKIRFVRDVSQNFQLYKFTKAIKLSMSSVIWLVKSNFGWNSLWHQSYQIHQDQQIVNVIKVIQLIGEVILVVKVIKVASQTISF